MARGSAEIKSDILNNLDRDTRLQSSKIKVDIHNGLAVITGSVQSYQAREAAEADIWAVSGVTSIDNRLQIIFPQEFIRPSDEAIRESVQRVLAWDPDIYLERIKAYVQESRVFLEGSVDTLWKKFRVEELVRSAGGVVDVINKLAVVPSSDTSDERIGQDITGLLSRNTAIDVNSISVEVQNGIVRLIGTVQNKNAFDIVEDIVRYTMGVVQIDNKLAIDSNG